MKTPTEKQERWAFKVYAGNYISEEDLEGLGISADWHLYLSPTEPPSAAECNQLMNAYELSSCPCCGGRATIIGTLKTCEWSAICTMCGLETAHMMQPKDAAAAWNRRYAPDDAGEDFEALSDAAKDRIGIPFPAPPATQQPEQPADKGEAVADRKVVGYQRGDKRITVEQMREKAGANIMEAVMIGGWEPVWNQPAQPDQPGEKARELVEKWRRESASVGHHRSISLCKALKSCADELQAALSAKGKGE